MTEGCDELWTVFPRINLPTVAVDVQSLQCPFTVSFSGPKISKECWNLFLEFMYLVLSAVLLDLSIFNFQQNRTIS